jgi:putative FmdB family regulatory protein
MPTYEYVCTSCDQRTEAVQAFSDPPLTVCPTCGGELRKVFGAVGIVLKGSGFYKTDSRKASTSSTAASNGQSKEKEKETSSASSSEPAAPKESSTAGSASKEAVSGAQTATAGSAG